mmetsp:Transcript_1757/g.4230  ORF Transcript_1757/g.4230 Transcript_1757/m.4230 type:complete len:265 (-) Transcript_1757:2642-3436(-)
MALVLSAFSTDGEAPTSRQTLTVFTSSFRAATDKRVSPRRSCSRSISNFPKSTFSSWRSDNSCSTSSTSALFLETSSLRDFESIDKALSISFICASLSSICLVTDSIASLVVASNRSHFSSWSAFHLSSSSSRVFNSCSSFSPRDASLARIPGRAFSIISLFDGQFEGKSFSSVSAFFFRSRSFFSFTHSSRRFVSFSPSTFCCDSASPQRDDVSLFHRPFCCSPPFLTTFFCSLSLSIVASMSSISSSTDSILSLSLDSSLFN